MTRGLDFSVIGSGYPALFRTTPRAPYPRTKALELRDEAAELLGVGLDFGQHVRGQHARSQLEMG